MKRLIKHGRVLVADGAHALVFENKAAPPAVHLSLLWKDGHDDRATHEIGSSSPGKVASRSGQRSAVEAPDYHQQAEDKFLRAIAARLHAELAERAFEQLIIVAPPAALATLRKALAADVARTVLIEINKDLTRHAVDDISAHVKTALDNSV